MMEPRLQLKQKLSLQLRLTPQLKLSLTILQKPVLELKTIVDQILAENPFLEAEGRPEREVSLERLAETLKESKEEVINQETDPSAVETLKVRHDYLINLAVAPPSLYDELLNQLHVEPSSPEDLRIGEAILGNLNERGYLTTPLGEIAQTLGVAEDAVARVLVVIQSFEPAGVGARNLKECLLIQLRAKGREGTLAWRALHECFEELGKRQFEKIANRLDVSIEQVREAVKEIIALEPNPGRGFGLSARPIVPDLIVERRGDDLEIESLNEYLPQLKVRTEYRSLLRAKRNDPSLVELKRQYAEAVGLVKALKARERTLEKIAEVLLKEQAEFFEKGPAYLKPLTAKALARKVGRHESTVSRAIADKYIATPFGLFPMHALLAKKVATETGDEVLNSALKEKIREVISKEASQQPLSDQGIVACLKAQGISLARRTVTKYRNALGLLHARLRRR